MKAPVSIAIVILLVFSSLAEAAPRRVARRAVEPLCRGGVLVSPSNGRPVLGPNSQTIPCGPNAAGGDSSPWIFGLAALGAVGGGAALALGRRGGGTTGFNQPQPSSP